MSVGVRTLTAIGRQVDMKIQHAKIFLKSNRFSSFIHFTHPSTSFVSCCFHDCVAIPLHSVQVFHPTFDTAR